MENGTLSITLPRHLFGPINVSLNKSSFLYLYIDGIVSIKANTLPRSTADSFQGFYAPNNGSRILAF